MIYPVLLQTSDFLWTTLHNYGFLRDVTNKALQLDIMREWFNAVQVKEAGNTLGLSRGALYPPILLLLLLTINYIVRWSHS